MLKVNMKLIPQCDIHFNKGILPEFSKCTILSKRKSEEGYIEYEVCCETFNYYSGMGVAEDELISCGNEYFSKDEIKQMFKVDRSFNKMKKVVITVKGGIANVTECSEGVEVEIINLDNDGECEDHLNEEDNLKCQLCGELVENGMNLLIEHLKTHTDYTADVNFDNWEEVLDFYDSIEIE